MHIPTSTLTYILLSIAVSPLAHSAPLPDQKTISPDIKRCRHTNDDPTCTPLSSDGQVSAIRDAHGRFGLLDQKSHHASSTSTSTFTLVPSPSTTITVSIPTLVYGSGPSTPASTLATNTNANAPLSNSINDGGVLSSRADDQGSQKWGGNRWGAQPFRRSLEHSIIARAGAEQDDSDGQASTENFNDSYGASPIKRELERERDLFETPAMESDTPSDNEDNVGNAKWGFGGGWGNPIKREDSTGNAKWGFGGGWGNPIKRFDSFFFPSSSSSSSSSSSFTSATSSPQSADAQTASTSDGTETGDEKWGMGGWAKPFKRDTRDFALPSFAGSSFSSSSGFGSDSGSTSTSVITTTAGVDGTGNAEWGWGGWGRPFARSNVETSAPPI